MIPTHPDDDVRGLYTPTMLAEWLDVPVAAIRRWHRRGYLQATREVRRLAYFAVEEVHVARLLSELLAAECSLASIDGKMDELARRVPDVARPLCELPVVVEGTRLLVRRGEVLMDASGQRILDFESAVDEELDDNAARSPALPISTVTVKRGTDASAEPSVGASDVEQLRELASELAGQGELSRAIEFYRSVLVSGSGTAEDQFTLGELLYRSGDPSAARERYYAAIELDEDYVEARANLGCVLAELGELELAEAAFRGALAYHEHYADAHLQLAKLLDRLGRPDEADVHRQRYLALVPESPWEAGRDS